jgi:hypothetical protein
MRLETVSIMCQICIKYLCSIYLPDCSYVHDIPQTGHKDTNNRACLRRGTLQLENTVLH